MKFRSLSLAGGVLAAACLCMLSCTDRNKEGDLPLKSQEIHARVLTVDTHADTPLRMLQDDWNIGERHDSTDKARDSKIDLPRMAEGGLDAEFFAVYVGQGLLKPEFYIKAKERALLLLDAIHEMCEKYPGLVELATSPSDAYRIEQEGKCAAFIGLENGYPIGRDLSLLKEYYDQGVRYVTLCHSADNDICDSSTDMRNPDDNGLSEFGKEVVAQCNRLGIMIDVSHASEKSFFDILEHSKAPVIASHSNVRSICDHPRNLSDAQLKALAEKGGVIQLSLVSDFIRESRPNPERDEAFAALRKKYGDWREIKNAKLKAEARQEMMEIYERFPGEKASLEELLEHIDYVAKLIGVDYVGIGSDFDGGGSIEGCNDVSEMPNITFELLKRGYTEDEIRKIWGENLMRVFTKVIQIAGKS
ncbi:MAG: dipeptidase [Candidatus Aminicenantes bacterium]|nr:dipeptidase [Candidatus Aminicenantes bacterium]